MGGWERGIGARVRHSCGQRGHGLLLADDAETARRWGADGVHRRGRSHGAALHSAPVHDVREIGEALRTGATLLFLSPLRATRSHPGQRPLGPTRFAMLARLCRPAKVIALGGMNRAHVGKWSRSIVHGWAAIAAV